MNRLMKDLDIDKAKDPMAFSDKFQQDDEDEDDDGDGAIIDRCKLDLDSFCKACHKISSSLAEEREYIDVTRVRRHDEGISWPRPG